MDAPEMNALTVIAAIGLPALLLAAAYTIVRAARARRRMEREACRLGRQAEQLRLLNRITFNLAQQTTVWDVASVATAFLGGDMGTGRAVFWRRDAHGEPSEPSLSFPDAEADGGPAGRTEPLPEAHRVILVRAAARGSEALVVDRSSNDERPRPLHPDEAPAESWIAFAPLCAGSHLEGVLEVYSGDRRWEPDDWALFAAVVAEVSGALRRARRFEETRERADHDFVTGLYNHRYVHSYLQGLATGDNPRFALVLMDVDNFKAFNDLHGHSVGDRVLQLVADQLKLMTDRVGLVGRFGGDEFCVILPNHDREEASAFAQAFQDWLATRRLHTASGETLPILVSWGAAAAPNDGDTRQELLAVADTRLYEYKRSVAHSRDEARPRDQVPETIDAFGFLDRLVTSVDQRDHYTRAHSEAVAEYAVILAEELGLSPSAQRTLRLAALLHDVGKVGIPDEILRKTGALSAEEFTVIRHHVTLAENLIVDVPNADEVRKLVRHHHERYDGSGYPDGLRGEAIPQLARILAVADAYCAMTLDRPYRRGLSTHGAYAELQRVAGAQLDPEMVEAFERVLVATGSEVGFAAMLTGRRESPAAAG
jgi:diguanylate cyclase (GGDEF)-like protein/putative nucleotidyltransferase with HDIG domain